MALQRRRQQRRRAGIRPARSAHGDRDGAVLHLNLFVPMLLAQALLPHLRAQAEARIVFVGSVLGRIGLPGFSVYSASKFGLRGFADRCAASSRTRTCGVQYLGPRSTRTGFNSDAVARYNEATGTAVDDPQVAARALLALLRERRARAVPGLSREARGPPERAVPAWLDGAFAKHRASLPAVAGAAALSLDCRWTRRCKPTVHSLSQNAS
jgi:short-subunit dehydrogenase